MIKFMRKLITGAMFGLSLLAPQVSLAQTTSGGGGVTNASVGSNGTTAPVFSTSIGSVDGSGNIQNASASTPVPVVQTGAPALPTNASTSILQPTNAAQGSTTSGQTGPLVQCATVSSAPTNTNAQTNALNCGTDGGLIVEGGVAQGSTTSGQKLSLIGGAVTTAAPSYTTAQTGAISLDTAGNVRTNCVTGCGSSASTGTTGAAVPASATYVAANNGGNLTGLTSGANGMNVSQNAATQISGTLQYAATTNGNGTPLNVSGMSSVVLTITGFTGNGVTFQGSEDGTHYSNILATQLGTNGPSVATYTLIGSTPTLWQMPVSGLQTILVPVTVATGSLTITAHAGPVDWNSRVINANVVGTPAVTVSGVAMAANQSNGTAGTPSTVVESVQGVSGGTTIPVTAAQATAANLNATVVGTGTFADQSTLQSGSVAQMIPGTTGGLTLSTITFAATTNATNLKASAGMLYHFSGYTAAAVPTWVSLYNTAGTPTCGTSIVWQFLIPANSTSGGGVVADFPMGLAFSTGIGYCATTGIAGTGSVAATSVVGDFAFK